MGVPQTDYVEFPRRLAFVVGMAGFYAPLACGDGRGPSRDGDVAVGGITGSAGSGAVGPAGAGGGTLGGAAGSGAGALGGTGGSNAAGAGSGGMGAVAGMPVAGGMGGLGPAGAPPIAGSGGESSEGVAGAGGAPGEQLADVVVRAGELDRDHTLVTFPYPAAPGQVLALRDADGSELAVQVDAQGTATFVLPALARNTEARFTLIRPTQTPGSAATGTAVAGAVQFDVAGNRALEFVTTVRLPAGVDASNARRGYLYPVFTPNGALVTDDYPPDDEVERMHLHHHGMWAAWTRTQFNGHPVDFWNPWGEGRVELGSVTAPWQGPVHAGLVATFTHEDMTDGGMMALNERWALRVYSTHSGAAPYYLFDLESTQEAINSPLRLEVYHYGGFAVRGAREWRGGNFQFITSEGDTSQPNEMIAPRANWVHIGGQVGAAPAGYALLSHPSNYCSPQGLRLHPTDPYFSILPVAVDMCGPFEIVPGTPYVSRFRFVTSDGPADPALLQRLFDDYATPPEVIVTF